MATYAELHVHSGFSFLDGASDPEELVAEAVRLGLSGLALTDHHGLYGAVRFAEAARSLGLPTIFGAELTLSASDDRHGIPDPSGTHLIVLARSVKGYRALSTMLGEAHLAKGEKGVPDLSWDEITRSAQDWLVLTGCRKGPLARALTEGTAAGRIAIDALVARFGRENLAVEIWDHGFPDDHARNEALVDLANYAKVQVVATNNVHYATPKDFRRANLLSALRARRSLDEMEGWLDASPTAHLRGDAEQRQRFQRWPGVVDRAGELAEELAFDLRLVAPQLPTFPTPPGMNEQRYLEELVEERATRKYGTRENERVPGAWRQIEHELNVIKTLGFAGYFLTVWDITEFCRKSNIFCQGRGSAANSAVCYSLGITNADAVSLNLFFERFLSPARDGPPDIDVDIESGRREEVIQYVFERYGRRHAAQVAAVITYRPRSALRDVARAFGYSEEQANEFRDRVDRQEMIAKGDDVSPLMLEMATELLHRPRHLGIHSAGMVLCDRPVIEVCPVEWGRMPGRTLLQWDKDDCAASGLVKFDLLGLGMLEALHRAVDEVKSTYGVSLDLSTLPQEEAVYDLLCEADTVGVFQVESRAQMATLPRIRPRTFYDIVIEVALIRPGPIQGNAVNPYIRRRRGDDPVTYLHPRLEPILKRTLGVPLFQEQLMEMAVAVAGFSPAEADELRQAMASKRSEIRMMKLKSRFYAGMAQNGIVGEPADELFHALSAFANFGFPESHAVSFAHLVYCSAWIKVHYPECFLVSLLNAQPMGFWSPQSLVADAKRHGVTVLRPDVNRSSTGAQTERYEDRWAVRLGLASVRGIGTEVAERIVAGAPWQSQNDLVRRAQLQQSHLEALASAGALDEFGSSRRALIWSAGAASQGTEDRLEGVVTGLEAPALTTPSPVERVADDLWSLGLTTEATAIELMRDELSAREVVTASSLTTSTARRVTVAGVVTHRQRPETARGAVFLNLEDETGHVNVVFSKGAWVRWREMADGSPALIIRGTLERGQGTLNLTAEFVEPLALGATAPSRDWH
jgi:error-prone DNA polymerase